MPFITQGKTNWKFLLIVIVLAVIAGGGALWYSLRKEQVEFSLSQNPSPQCSKDEDCGEGEICIKGACLVDETADWQNYRNNWYGFEFKYPPIPAGCENCIINFDDFNDEIFSVGRLSLRVEDLEASNLSEYVYNIFPRERGEVKVEEADGSQYLKETFVESRKNITVGGQEAIKVDYRFGGTGRFGTTTFVKRDDWVITFEFTTGGFCCDSSIDTIYEEEVYEAMLSTFSFLGNCLEVQPEKLIMNEITDESLKELVNNYTIGVFKSYSGNVFCMSPKITIQTHSIDLNKDGKSEYVVLPECLYDGDNLVYCPRGASYNGPITVFGYIDGEWQEIGDLFGNIWQPLDNRATKGYLDLFTHSHNSAASGNITKYSWDGTKYKQIKSFEYGPEAPPLSAEDKEIFEEFFPG